MFAPETYQKIALANWLSIHKQTYAESKNGKDPEQVPFLQIFGANQVHPRLNFQKT